MVDVYDSATRRRVMQAIKASDTKPEVIIRRIVRSLGFPGYRLHRKDIPGKPDIAFIGRRLAIFVHGCFWHGHSCPRGRRVPKTNIAYWRQKIEGNKARDKAHGKELSKLGWRSLIIWECELRDLEAVRRKLLRFLTGSTPSPTNQNFIRGPR